MEPQPLGPQRARANQRSSGLLGHSRDLWRDAPGWRLLVGSTAALVVASAATALLAQRHDIATPAAVTAVLSERAPPTATVPPPPAPVAPRPVPAPQAAPASQPVPVAPPQATLVTPSTTRPAPPELQLAPAPNETACDYRGGSGAGGQGRVVGFLSHDQAAKLLAFTQQKTGAKINPDYVRNVRVMITAPNGRRVVVLAPSGLTVKPGDRVAFTSGHRDWSMACGYVPNLIIGLLQPE